MRCREYLFPIGIVAAGVAAGLGAATAQEVLQRARPEYDPKGLPVGAFRLFPTLDVAFTSDDNVFRNTAPTVSDTYFAFSPRAELQSEWTNHELVIRGGANVLEYGDQSDESRTEWDVGGDLRLDVLRTTIVNFSASHDSLHEARGLPDTPGFAAEPTPYSVSHLEANFSHKPNRLGVRTGVSYDVYDFDSTKLLAPGGLLNNDDRDRDVVEFFGEGSYEFSPGYATFIRAAYNDRKYDLALDRTGVSRDSDGYRVNTGLQMLVSPLIQGDIYVGYLKQNYVAPLTDVSGFDFGAALVWFASPLVTVHLNASRTVGDSTLTGVSGTDDTTFAASFDYELRRNILVQGDLSYIDSDFQGIGRQDEIFNAGIGLRYLINSYMNAHAGYRYSTRDSSVVGQGFDANAFTIGLGLQL